MGDDGHVWHGGGVGTPSRAQPRHQRYLRKPNIFLNTIFGPRVKEGPLSVPSFYFMYNIRQDAGIRTRVAATAARFATNELHTSLMIYKHP